MSSLTSMFKERKPSVELTIEQKKKVIDLLDKGEKATKIASTFEVSNATTISAIEKKKLEIISTWEENCDGDRKRNLRKAELEFFNLCRQQNIPISGPLLQEKALKIAASMGIIDFKATNGRLEKFRQRNNIDFRVLNGEAGDLDTSAVQSLKRRIPAIIEGYETRDIFNADETALFYRATPSKSLVLRGEINSGTKQSKDRLSILLAASMTGKATPLQLACCTFSIFHCMA